MFFTCVAVYQFVLAVVTFNTLRGHQTELFPKDSFSALCDDGSVGSEDLSCFEQESSAQEISPLVSACGLVLIIWGCILLPSPT